MADKPELSLVAGRTMTADDLAALYEKLTGKVMTAAERAYAERALESGPDGPLTPAPVPSPAPRT